MKETFITRVAGASSLLSVVAQFAAVGLAFRLGIVPGRAIDLADATQLVAANANHTASVLGLSLATLAPAVALPLGLGLYVVLSPARGYALFGLVMFYVGMTITLVHEVLRVVLFARLPPAYVAAPEEAKSAILVLGDVLTHADAMFSLISFIVSFGLGFSAFAFAILSLRVVPRWLGWLLLVPAVGVGLVGFPLLFFGVDAAGMLIPPGMSFFLVWQVAIGVVLLRWQPPADVALSRS